MQRGENLPVSAINWNRLDDPKDLEVWNRLTGNFWLPEQISLLDDTRSWSTVSDQERYVITRLLTSAARLESLQVSYSLAALIPQGATSHEKAVYTNMAFMKSVHVKCYSTILSALVPAVVNDEIFRWAEENSYLTEKIRIIYEHYCHDSSLHCKIALTLLENFLYYSSFYFPMYLSSRGKLVNTADMIRLIIRDNTVYGYYLGYKYQHEKETLSGEQCQELKDYTYDLLFELYENEVEYTQDLYDRVNLTEDVKKFLRYNANIALTNLGYEPLFPHDETNVSPTVLSAVSINGEENCNLFSQSSLSHVGSKAVSTCDEDWNF